MSGRVRDLLVCTLLPLAGALAAFPILEMGVNDDWSYTYIARVLADTGQFRYNGWGAMPLVPQAYLAALVIRVFGFSFTAVRMLGILFACGCGALLYDLGHRSGLRSAFAVFGSLALTLSPMSLHLSASFHSDIPGWFFSLACLYGALRAATAATTRASGLWLAATALAGALAGTTRQFYWPLPLLAIPIAVWMRRADRRLLPIGAALWITSGLACALTMRWFYAQPFIVSPNLLLLPPWPLILRLSFSAVTRFGMTALLLLLPVLVLYASGWRRLPRLGAWLAGLLVLGFGGAVTFFKKPDFRFPWLGNIVTSQGIMGDSVLGDRPLLLTRLVCLLLSLGVFAAAGLAVMAIVHTWDGRRARSSPAAGGPAAFVLLFAPFGLAYLASVVLASLHQMLWDRYVLPWLPGLAIPLLWYYQESRSPRIPVPGWLLLGIFGIYGVTTNHDYLAMSRARLAAASAVEGAGVPRREIAAGFEYDGWTQIEEQGYVLSPLMESIQRASPQRHGVLFYFWENTPAVQPRYFVVVSRYPDLRDTAFPPVAYVTWLPPSRRQVWTQTVP